MSINSCWCVVIWDHLLFTREPLYHPRVGRRNIELCRKAESNHKYLGNKMEKPRLAQTSRVFSVSRWWATDRMVLINSLMCAGDWCALVTDVRWWLVWVAPITIHNKHHLKISTNFHFYLEFLSIDVVKFLRCDVKNYLYLLFWWCFIFKFENMTSQKRKST